MSIKLHNPKSYAPAVYIPCWLIQVPIKQLSHGAKITYGRLSQWADELGHAFRSAKQLGEEIGTSPDSIEKYLKELRKAKLLGTYHPQAGGVNHFEFYDHPWMHSPLKEQLVYKNDKRNLPANPTAPTGGSYGTLPEDLTDINNKEIKKIKLCGASPSHTQNSIKKLKKENCEKLALADKNINEIFIKKFSEFNVSIEEMFEACQNHYEQKSLWATKDKFLKWINSEETTHYKKIKPSSTNAPLTKAASTKELEYKAYISQFRNDRDFLKLQNVQGKEPMTFKEWMSYANNETMQDQAL